MKVSRFVVPVLVGVLAFAGGWATSARSHTAPRGGLPDRDPPLASVDYPTGESPTGRRHALLVVRRVTGGPEGAVEYGPVAERVGPDGTRDLVVTPDDFVVTIGKRTYLMTPRD